MKNILQQDIKLIFSATRISVCFSFVLFVKFSFITKSKLVRNVISIMGRSRNQIRHLLLVISRNNQILAEQKQNEFF